MESSNHTDTENLLAAYRLTNDDLALFTEGLADEETARRVTGAALVEPAIRARVDLLRALEEAENAWQEAPTAAAGESARDTAAASAPDFPARAEALRRRMHETARSVAGEAFAAASGTEAGYISDAAADESGPERFTERITALLRGQANSSSGSSGTGGGLWRVAAQALEAVLARLARSGDSGAAASIRTLTTGRLTLTLPCLAPAAAAPAADMTLRRQKVTTPDGVLIEFQQLPGGPPRLRLLIDASLLAEDFETLGYNAAFVTLEETRPQNAEESEESLLLHPPDRHVLIVKLNRMGRGFTDFLIAADSSSPSVLPAPRGGCHLVGATLSRLPEETEEVFTASSP